jgi:hypothetical protein
MPGSSLPSDDTIGFGIVGAGMIAEYHRDAITANADAGARLIAVAYHRDDRRSEISRRFAVPVMSEEDLLNHRRLVCISCCVGSSSWSCCWAARSVRRLSVFRRHPPRGRDVAGLARPRVDQSMTRANDHQNSCLLMTRCVRNAVRIAASECSYWYTRPRAEFEPSWID